MLAGFYLSNIFQKNIVIKNPIISITYRDIIIDSITDSVIFFKKSY